MVGCCGMAQHPVEYLFSKLKDLKYPDGLVAVPERIRRDGFLPRRLRPVAEDARRTLAAHAVREGDGAGEQLRFGVRVRKISACRDMNCIHPHGGSCYGCCRVRALTSDRRTASSPTLTWDCLPAAPTNTGESPGAKDPEFKRRCRLLLAEQIAVQRPRLILALGRFVPKFLASLSPDLAEWRKWPGFQALDASGPLKRVRFDDTGEQATTVVVLLHPSAWNRKCRRYRGQVGHDAELTMLREAMGEASLTN